jgi:hypothetical protein
MIGYTLEITRNVYLGQDVPLPEWDELGSYLVRGLLLSIALLIWTLPLLTIAAAIVAGALAASGSDTLVVIVSGVVVVLLWIVIAGVVYPLVMGRYAFSRSFADMLQVDEVVREARAVFPSLLYVALLVLGIYLTAAIVGAAALLVGMLVTIPFAMFVVAHLYGQVYRLARGLDPDPVPDSAALAGETIGP